MDTSHPEFSWTVSGDRANTVTVSRTVRTTPAGQFYDQDYVTSDGLGDGATRWVPTTAITSGSYWWNIGWYGNDYSSSGYTPPRAFTITASIRNLRASVLQYSLINSLTATVSWWSNTPTTKTVCQLYRGKRVVSRARGSLTAPSIAVRNTTTCNLNAREKWDGERLRLVIDVSGGGLKRSTTVRFRAK